MSGAVTLGVGLATGIPAGAAAFTSVLIRPYRAIGYVIPDVVVEEDGRDGVVLTDHPVETGAEITDHAYVRPCEVRIRAMWTPATGGYETYIQDIYNALLTMMNNRQPITVVTGKRLYPNMMVVEIRVPTNQEREYILEADVTLRQVILVDTQSVTLPPQADHSMPQQTAPVQDTGPKVPSPAAPQQSGLLQGFNSVSGNSFGGFAGP